MHWKKLLDLTLSHQSKKLQKKKLIVFHINFLSELNKQLTHDLHQVICICITMLFAFVYSSVAKQYKLNMCGEYLWWISLELRVALYHLYVIYKFIHIFFMLSQELTIWCCFSWLPRSIIKNFFLVVPNISQSVSKN